MGEAFWVGLGVACFAWFLGLLTGVQLWSWVTRGKR